MMRRFFKALFVGGTEMLLAIGLVFVLALVFLGILIFSFPKGTGLVSYYDELVSGQGRDSRLVLQGLDDSDESIALLTRVQRRVRDRPAHSIVWNSARAGMPLGDRHTVQTLARSGALIDFDGRHKLTLGEKSLIVVKRSERRRHSARQASLVILGGKVRGSVAPTEKARGPLNLVTAAGSSKIRPQGSEQAEFNMTVNPDNSSTFSVFSGVAEVTAGGQTALVEPNHSITLIQDQPPGPAVEIPDPPDLVEPADRAVELYGSIAPRVNFAWGTVEAADSYRLVISRDRQLTDLVHTESLSGTRFAHGNLEPGKYYWQVHAVRGHAESLAGGMRSLEIIRDVDPPQLRVTLPDDVESEQVVIAGVTEPGSKLLVSNQEVPVGSDGAFEYALNLKRGLNMIVIEAIDSAGNSAYHSQYVSAKF